jgi:hypothetical protein
MNASHKLDTESTSRTIEAALRTHAQVVLAPAGHSGVSINGYLISGDDLALLMEVTGQPAIESGKLIQSDCQVTLFSDQQYLFNTTVTGAPAWGHSRSLVIARPDQIRVVERRRSARAALAPSSRVLLEWTHKGVGHRHIVALLNVSPEGLACRIEDGEVAIAKDEVLHVGFKLPGGERSYSFRATVANRTPTPEGSVILGLEFVVQPDETSECEQLRQCLGGGMRIEAGRPVCV